MYIEQVRCMRISNVQMTWKSQLQERTREVIPVSRTSIHNRNKSCHAYLTSPSQSKESPLSSSRKLPDQQLIVSGSPPAILLGERNDSPTMVIMILKVR